MLLGRSPTNPRVIVLALWCALAGSGCTFFQPRFQVNQNCSSRVYVSSPVGDHVGGTAATSPRPLRLAVVPFSVPANLAGSNNELPGLGNTLAWKVHSEALSSGEFPVTEVFNRQDWPGKKEEFFTGNFGAISLAQAAGYDLVLTGLIDNIRDLDSLSAYAKLIDVSSGVTIWYGKSTIRAVEHRDASIFDSMWRSTDEPAQLYTAALADDLGRCIVRGILAAR